MSLHALPKWLRWSNTRQAWQERLGSAAVVAGAVLLSTFTADAPTWLLVLGWATLALLLAYFSRRGWVKLFGPVLFYDLLRSGRRARAFLVRSVYLGILLLTLCWMYLVWAPHGRVDEPIRSSRVAEFSLLFFFTFMAVQLALVVVLTPAYTAGAIADEKERKTLEFILATDLRSREIVFGKLLSRMAHLSLFILAGLPVLSALQFLGGIPPLAVLIGFAGTGVTMASLACLSLYASVLCRRTRDALLFVYLLIFAYLVVSFLAFWPLFQYPAFIALPSTDTWQSPLTVEDILLAMQAGNPIIVMQRVSPRRGLDLDALPKALETYALFHGLLASGCLLAAIGSLRRASLKEPRVPRAAALRKARRPAIGLRPMIWKEIWLERLVKRRWLIGGVVFLLMVLSFLPPSALLWDYYCFQRNYFRNGDPWEGVGREINEWLRFVGTAVACLGLVGVAVRAATSIRSEHDRDTITSLLTTPLTSEEILFGKWLGSIVSMRWFAVWLSLIWFTGVCCNGLSPFMVPLLVGACLVYAGAVASLGLWFSVICRSSLRAIVATLLAALMLSVGHWLPWMCCVPFLHGPGSDFETIAQLQLAITPPAVIGGFFSMSLIDLERIGDPKWNPYWLIFLGMSGTIAWAVFAWLVWLAANERFKKDGGRLDGSQPSPSVPTGAAQRQAPSKLQATRRDDRFVEGTDNRFPKS